MVNHKYRLYQEHDLQAIWPRVANIWTENDLAGRTTQLGIILRAVLAQYVESDEASETIKDSFKNRKPRLCSSLRVKVARILKPDEISLTATYEASGLPNSNPGLTTVADSGVNRPEHSTNNQNDPTREVDWKREYESLLSLVGDLRKDLACTRATLGEYQAASALNRWTLVKLNAENEIFRSRFAGTSTTPPPK